MDKVFPITLINIHLPDEPMTASRSYCLRQMSETQWATCYYREDTDSFLYGNYFTNVSDAYEAFHIELNRQMERYNHLISLFYKYRDYINSQESK